MPKLKLLILDANVVIWLHEADLWQAVLSRCEIHLSRIVAESEVRYYRRDDYDEIIDLSVDIEAGRIQVFDVAASDLEKFRDRFDPPYFGDLDDGEAESLAFMFDRSEEFLISSGDAIVFRILGNLSSADQGLSLEEILQKIGLGRGGLPRQYTKVFREYYTEIGQQDMIQGSGRRSTP